MAKKLVTKVIFEVGDIQVNIRDVMDSVKVAWVNAGNSPDSLNELTFYIKAEDRKAYFIGNGGKVKGSVALSNADDLSNDVIFE
ncbi:DUF6465 family protein [Ruminococcus albus]|uniref:Uncharacterized protein n=1 Tax=Ruminococcus albus (strain ATCC 27210 / DSM 20455 / JCM 14654 / NCDO 2250 / 7) TaxID=697329 RepID=E6UKA4_RUMA7|nr:DUF6465 family protein [Ruminococcus albus]ADU24100.1 hypothetical protein Rumal_3661 [Ruminococcus albus 7 = DSM 20455]